MLSPPRRYPLQRVADCDKGDGVDDRRERCGRCRTRTGDGGNDAGNKDADNPIDEDDPTDADQGNALAGGANALIARTQKEHEAADHEHRQEQPFGVVEDERANGVADRFHNRRGGVGGGKRAKQGEESVHRGNSLLCAVPHTRDAE